MMHDRRIVHRDIKPANILVGQGEELVKICDLGLAISMSELPPYTQAGTASYMAPEMLLGKPDYNARVDTWSLGCVMAEMLTGKTLFLAEDDDEDDKEIAQLWSIFRLLGMPDEKTWPRFRYLPLAAKALQLLPAEHKRNRLRYFFPEEKLSKEGFQVLQGLLTCNPDKRLTAAKALKLPWFNALRTAAAAKIDASVVVPPRKKTPRIKFIPPAEPAEKITFKIPLAMWNAERV
jgi:cell division cycle 2-like protein